MPPVNPTFALSRVPTVDDDAVADWQRHIDAGRIGARRDRTAVNAAADAIELAVLGPRATRRRW